MAEKFMEILQPVEDTWHVFITLRKKVNKSKEAPISLKKMSILKDFGTVDK